MQLHIELAVDAQQMPSAVLIDEWTLLQKGSACGS
jgi:hypothetical protein